jgi:hypothetical protein
MFLIFQEEELVDNEVCTFDYAVEDREATASTLQLLNVPDISGRRGG